MGRAAKRRLYNDYCSAFRTEAREREGNEKEMEGMKCVKRDGMA